MAENESTPLTQSDSVTAAPGQVWKRRWYADLTYLLGPFMPKYLRVLSVSESNVDGRLVSAWCEDGDGYDGRKYDLPVNRRGRIPGFRLFRDADSDTR